MNEEEFGMFLEALMDADYEVASLYSTRDSDNLCRYDCALELIQTHQRLVEDNVRLVNNGSFEPEREEMARRRAMAILALIRADWVQLKDSKR